MRPYFTLKFLTGRKFGVVAMIRTLRFWLPYSRV